MVLGKIRVRFMKRKIQRLENRNFFFFIIGYTLLLLAIQFIFVATNLLVWDQSNSALIVALNQALKCLPTVLLGPFLGGLIDRVNKKYLLVLLAAISYFLLIIPVFTLDVRYICFFSFMYGIVQALTYPCVQAFIPEIVESKNLLTANSQITFGKTCAQLIGPVLGAAMISLMGSRSPFIIAMMLNLAAAYAFIKVKWHAERQGKKFFVANDIITGIKMLLSNKEVLCLLVIISILLMYDGALNVLIIIYAKNKLLVSDFEYGVLTSIQGLGMVVSSLFTRKIVCKTGYSLNRNLLIFAILKILFTMSIVAIPNIGFFALILCVENFVWISVTIIENTILQTTLEEGHRAKIFAIYGSAAWLMSMIGNLLFGKFFDNYDITCVMLISGIIFCLGIAIVCIIRAKKCKESMGTNF